MTRAEVTLLIQQKQQLPLSACLCGVCGADYIGWLGGRSRSLQSVSLHSPKCPMAHGLCCMSPHRTRHRWIQSSVSVGCCLSSVVGGNGAQDGEGRWGCPSFTPRLASAAVAFQRRKIDTEPSEHAARQKEGQKGYVFAWHGMAGCLVCMARWGGQILPRASLRGSWCFMPSSRHPVLSGLLDSTSMVGKQNSIDGRARQAALLLGNHPPVCLVPPPNSSVPPKRRRWC